MPFVKILSIFILLLFFPVLMAHAAGERNLIIQKEMDCIDEHLPQASGITWNDVCDVPESSYQKQIEAVNQQMDQIQGIAAPSQTAVQVPQPVVKKSEWVYTIAPEVSYIRYHEPGLMKESGTMSGLSGIFTYHPPEGNPLNTEITDVYRFEAKFSYGKVSYHGGIEYSDGSSTPESFNGINDYMLEVRDIAGKDFDFNQQTTRLTPYFGAGYRSLYDAMVANKPYGYNRHIQYVYLPLGAEAMTKLMDGWSIGADAEYDLLIRGFATSYLETIGYGKLTNTQNNGYGLRGSIKLIKSEDRFNFILEPYVRFWHIQNSHGNSTVPFLYQGQEYVVNGYDEPNNNSIEIGGSLGIEF